MSNLKEMIAGKVVNFLYYRDGEFVYQTECGFKFPVPLNDLGKATLKAQDKAILFMRYIRKHKETIELDKTASIA